MNKFIFLAIFIPTLTQAEDFTFDKNNGKAMPNYIGELKTQKGILLKESEGKKAPIGSDARFYKSDILYSEKMSMAKILMIDDTLITLGSNSVLKFENYEFKDKTDRKSVYQFIKGQIKGEVKNKAKPSDIVLKTDFTSMAVRGTVFFVNQQKIKNLLVTEFAVTEGEVEVTDDNNQKFKVKVPEHLIIIRDEIRKQSASDTIQLTSEMLEVLKKEDNLLPHLDLKTIESNAKLSATLASNESTEVSSENNVQIIEKVERSENQKNWRYNLKKLNEELKKNQNKKN